MCTSVTLPMIFPPQPSFGATSKQQGHSKTTRPGRVLIPSTSHTTSQDPSPTPVFRSFQGHRTRPHRHPPDFLHFQWSLITHTRLPVAGKLEKVSP
ncbi:uncharacterized protein [Littorina saxatilis]|uniref:uncharacterized protein isoform X2 n=1 Tax=Littorina saxatilis TaxID=31220 RepID=UPI0038B446F2